MAIEYSNKKSLGADVNNFPKVQQAKIKELIDAVNDLTDGTVDTINLNLSGTLEVDGISTFNNDILATAIGEIVPGSGIEFLDNAQFDSGITINKGTVTQTGAITTGVTVNATAGVITTVSSTLAAGSNATFIVTNSKALVGSSVQLTVDDSATAGLAKLNVQTIAAGVFSINITNIHATNAFNNILKIHFLIV